MTEKVAMSLYKDSVNIEFFPNSHRYKKDGIFIPSVTSITGVVDKSRVLMDWCLRLTKEKLMEKFGSNDDKVYFSRVEIDEAIAQKDIKSDEAKSIGTMVHEFAEYFTKYKLGKISKEEVMAKMPTNENARMGVEAFVKWVKENNIEFFDAEKMVYSKKYNFVGLCDSMIIINGKTHILDYKTSKGIYPEYLLQVSAYKLALDEEYDENFGLPLIVKFGKDDGNFQTYQLTQEDYDS